MLGHCILQWRHGSEGILNRVAQAVDAQEIYTAVLSVWNNRTECCCAYCGAHVLHSVMKGVRRNELDTIILVDAFSDECVANNGIVQLPLCRQCKFLASLEGFVSKRTVVGRGGDAKTTRYCS